MCPYKYNVRPAHCGWFPFPTKAHFRPSLSSTQDDPAINTRFAIAVTPPLSSVWYELRLEKVADVQWNDY